ncbi:hypothetical protein LVJ94_23875 [Pendulispora rubella]|uniref:Lipoprotein n=1 Tax=Pendulispora rubella TaxID=2741070 RepID=A0ABZ2LH32_9BACT
MLFRRLSLLISALIATGCTPSIGDSCTVSTNCSSSGDRLCDNSQPGGYCTVFNCQPDRCPEEAACVQFHAAVDGCPYSDRSQRSAKSFCVKHCDSDSDCRPEYRCAAPGIAPYFAQILDRNQDRKVCVPTVGGTLDAGTSPDNPLVCQPGSVVEPPNIDASSPVKPDAGATDAGATDAGTDAGDASADGGG